MSASNAHAPSHWERAREDYLCGDTAAEVCARYGLSRSQFYAHARTGGWRKADQPGAFAQPFAGPPEPEPDDGAPAPPTPDLAAEALRQGARAIAGGRLREAQGWVRLAAQLRTLAMQETHAQTWVGVLDGRRKAPATAPTPAPDPTDDFAAVMRTVQEVGRIAREATALLDRADAPESEAAAEALLARADALLQDTGGAEPLNDDAAVRESPVVVEGATPCTTSGLAAGPDGLDGLFVEPESGGEYPPPPPFRGSEDGPEWPTYCRARAVERPRQAFWLTWAQMAEEKQAAAGLSPPATR